MKKKVSILGSTGSIGQSALDVIAQDIESYDVVALAANRNGALLAEQVKKFKPGFAALNSPDNREPLDALKSDYDFKIGLGPEAVIEAATWGEPDIVVAGISGSSGLLPTYAAIKSGITIALANKETLVMGGEFVISEAKRYGSRILPVDSEHSAIFQSLLAGEHSEVNRLILTASGGPFYNSSLAELANAVPEDALKHPVWDMGAKITVGSAAMSNKGLEVIEAVRLFGIDHSRIDVVIHPQSFIHSMVEFIDGSIIAQMGMADMRVPIQYALTWPRRKKTPVEYCSFSKIQDFRLLPKKDDVFRALPLAYNALDKSPAGPIAYNAADEKAIEAFLAGRIKFLQMSDVIEETLSAIDAYEVGSVEDILEIDKIAARLADGAIDNMK
jgi:1-deoxy-D-xylulose-5-phosphate reductoisomerase